MPVLSSLRSSNCCSMLLLRHVEYIVLLCVVLMFLKVLGRRLVVKEQVQEKGGGIEMDGVSIPAALF